MKKTITLLLALVLLLSLGACGGKAATYHDSGYWAVVRVERNDPDAGVSEGEQVYSEALGRAMYLELNADGTGTLLAEEERSITWQDGRIVFPEEGKTYPYTLETGELFLPLADSVLTCRRREAEELLAAEGDLSDYRFMEVGVPYPHTTTTSENNAVATTAEAIVTSYEVFESAPDYPPKEGYEWRIVKMQVRYYDEIAEEYGCDITPIMDDYYNTRLYNDTTEVLADTEDYDLLRSTVLWGGEEKEVYLQWHGINWGDWYANERNHVEIICYLQWDFLVPVGYDGSIAGLQDARLDWPEGTYITDYDPERLVLFRAD